MPNATKKQLSFRRKAAFSLLLILIFLLLIVAAGEIIVRLTSNGKYAKPTLQPPYDTAQKDEKLGWRMKPNYAFDGKMRDQAGVEYPISIRYDANGFKAFGNTASTKPKVLFLGDSYTASIEVSNEKSFFNRLKDSLGIEVFAYGHAGFSTLQEYLVLDEWVDKIRPDAVVWQVCSNDFIDNYAPLEIRCGYKVGERRPYLKPGDGIFYRRPLSFWQKIKERLHFFKWLEERWDKAKLSLLGKEKRVGEYWIATEKRAYPPFDGSVRMTEEIVGKIKKRLPPGTPLLAFSADVYQPQLDEFKRIFEMHGFPFTEVPARSVERAAVEQKLVVKAVDGYHWNELGHEVIARELAVPLGKILHE
ncbi:MAG: SGNH/GDSL hydrolase family protein [Bacteroidota bacterium]